MFLVCIKVCECVYACESVTVCLPAKMLCVFSLRLWFSGRQSAMVGTCVSRFCLSSKEGPWP